MELWGTFRRSQCNKNKTRKADAGNKHQENRDAPKLHIQSYTKIYPMLQNVHSNQYIIIICE